MGIKKNIKKLMSSPTNMALNEVINVLEFFGYKLDRVSGSHHQFIKHGNNLITIAVHNKKVEKFYLKMVKKNIIKEITLKEDENF